MSTTARRASNPVAANARRALHVRGDQPGCLVEGGVGDRRDLDGVGRAVVGVGDQDPEAHRERNDDHQHRQVPNGALSADRRTKVGGHVQERERQRHQKCPGRHGAARHAPPTCSATGPDDSLREQADQRTRQRLGDERTPTLRRPAAAWRSATSCSSLSATAGEPRPLYRFPTSLPLLTHSCPYSGSGVPVRAAKWMGSGVRGPRTPLSPRRGPRHRRRGGGWRQGRLLLG